MLDSWININPQIVGDERYAEKKSNVLWSLVFFKLVLDIVPVSSQTPTEPKLEKGDGRSRRCQTPRANTPPLTCEAPENEVIYPNQLDS